MAELSVVESFLTSFGLPMGLFALTLIAGAKGIWVWGFHYREVKQERDYWREVAFNNLKMAEKVTDVARKQVFSTGQN